MAKLVSGLSPFRRMFTAGGALAALATAMPLVVGTPPAAAAASSPFDSDIAAFYRSRGGAPLWFAPGSGNAAQQLIQLLATASADHLNPRRYNVRGLQRAVADARSGNPAAIQRAEVMLSAPSSLTPATSSTIRGSASFTSTLSSSQRRHRLASC